MYAVVSSGGKQYRVEPGSMLTVERVSDAAGSTITFDRVLLVADGETVTVGTPIVDGASVSGTVIGEARGPKIIVFKFKQKVKYRRRTGHRQHLTEVRIDSIKANGRTETAEDRRKQAAKEQSDSDDAARRASTRSTRKTATAKATGATGKGTGKTAAKARVRNAGADAGATRTPRRTASKTSSAAKTTKSRPKRGEPKE